MLKIFTRREVHVLILFFLSLIVLGIALFMDWVDQQTLEGWSTPAMIFIVLPIGIYLITDKDRLAIINYLENGPNSNPDPNSNIGNNE